MSRKVEMVPGSIQAISALRSCPLVALDIGVGAGESTGIAWAAGSILDSACLTLPRALERTVDELKDGGALVVEAPLSGLRSVRRTPIGRAFESRRIDGRKKYRYWYTGSGPDVALAAMIFLRDLLEALSADRGNLLSLHIYEGFLSFKQAPTPHLEDAEKLRDTFLEAPRDRLIEVTEREGIPLSLLKVAGLTSDARPPVVVAP